MVLQSLLVLQGELIFDESKNMLRFRYEFFYFGKENEKHHLVIVSSLKAPHDNENVQTC